MNKLTTKLDSMVSVLDYGVFTENPFNDDSIIINSVILDNYISANDNKEINIPDGSYYIQSPVVVKAGVKVHLSHRAILCVQADVDAVHIEAGGVFSGGKIEYYNTTPSDSTSAVVFLPNGGLAYSRLEDTWLHGNASVSGAGVTIKNLSGDGTGLISMAGVRIDSFGVPWNIVASNGGWTNGVQVTDSFATNFVTGALFDGAGGCTFENVQWQTSTATQRVLHFTNGANGNQINGFIWDSVVGANTIVFDSGAYNNKVNTNTPLQQVTDIGGLNAVSSSFRLSRSSGTSPILLSGIEAGNFSAPGGGSGTLIEDIHDYLAYADQRFTVTASSIPASGVVGNLFRPDTTYTDFGPTAGLPLTIEIVLDPVSADPAGIEYIGFSYSNITPNVLVETYLPATSSWSTVACYTAPDTDHTNVVMFPTTYTQALGSQKIRITFTGPYGSGYLNKVKLYRIFALATKKQGKVWFPLNGGTVYGDVTLPPGYKFNGSGAGLTNLPPQPLPSPLNITASGATPQFVATYDNSNYTYLRTSSNGAFNIQPSSGLAYFGTSGVKNTVYVMDNSGAAKWTQVLGNMLRLYSGSGYSITLDGTTGSVTAGYFVAGVVALTSAATITLDAHRGQVFTVTPSEDTTFTAINLSAGQQFDVVIDSTGGTPVTATFGTGFKTQGSIATGAAGESYVVSFICPTASCAVERSRTTVR